jgi:hypothetical protein
MGVSEAEWVDLEAEEEMGEVDYVTITQNATMAVTETGNDTNTGAPLPKICAIQ